MYSSILLILLTRVNAVCDIYGMITLFLYRRISAKRFIHSYDNTIYKFTKLVIEDLQYLYYLAIGYKDIDVKYLEQLY